jgi:hypothetical protein
MIKEWPQESDCEYISRYGDSCIGYGIIACRGMIPDRGNGIIPDITSNSGSRYVIYRMAEVMVSKALFREILEHIRGLAMAILPSRTG